jgi:hypothetical protein
MKTKAFFGPKPRPLFSALDRRKTVYLSDLAEAADIPISTLRDWLNRGDIPGMYRSAAGKGRKWRMTREAAEQWWINFQSELIRS